MADLTLKLLGGFEVYRPSSPAIAFRTRKAKALLAYLAWPPGTQHSRDKLAALLWGGSGDAQARDSLRNNLSMLRKSLSDTKAAIVVGNADRLYLDPRSVDVDAATFDHLVSQGTTEAFEQAASLCTGEFLEDFDLREEGFAEWVAAERARFHEKLVTVLTRLLETHLASGDVEKGIQVAFRLIRNDPLQEWAHSALIRLYLQKARYGAALRQYETYRVLLAKELGVAPSAEIEALYQDMRNHRRSAEENTKRRISPNDDAGTGEQADLAGVSGRAVAILPFANLNQDTEQELFADGLTEDIIFALSATRSFPVLARNAIMAFKGRAVDAQTAGKLLGAAYVLEGSVRRSGDQLRIIVELVDVETRLQLWSERYDRPMDDLFAVQDDITTTVVATLEPEIDVQEMRRVMVAQPLTKLSAYERAQRGFWHLMNNTVEDYKLAMQQFESSLCADPQYARAYAGMAQAKYFAGLNLWEDSGAAMEQAIELGRAALNLDDRDPRALRYLGGAHIFLGHYDEGLQALRRTIAVHPSYAMAYSGLALALVFVGEFEDAVTAEETTERLRPGDRMLFMCKMSKGLATYQMYEYVTVERVCRESLGLNDQYWMSNLVLVAALGQNDDIRKAEAPIDRLGRLLPPLTEEGLLKLLPFKERAHLDHIVEGLRKAHLDVG